MTLTDFLTALEHLPATAEVVVLDNDTADWTPVVEVTQGITEDGAVQVRLGVQ